MQGFTWAIDLTFESNADFQNTRVIRSCVMTTLTVTMRGLVTFRKDVLKHLDIQAGDKIRLDLLPDGRQS